MKKIIFTVSIGIILLILFSSTTKPVYNAVVSSASPEATAIGIKILESGGNAIDAVVAISFALGVSEPAMSGIGGGSQLLISIPGKEPFLINGTTYAPALTDPMIPGDSLTYHKRATIPSTVKVLDYALKKYGSGKFSWSQLLEPSIKLARDGFIVGRFRADVYKMYEKSMTGSPYHTQLWLKDGNQLPVIGDKTTQPVLAKTIERLAKFGADDFYKGEIAKAISKDMEQNGGWIRVNDLKKFPEPKELPALRINYKGYDVFSMPPPGAGYAVLQLLKLYEKLGSAEKEMPEHEKWARILQAVHNDLDQHPVVSLTNYEAEINERLSETYLNKLLSNLQHKAASNQSDGETTHFSVVDKNGMAVAVTASINAYFGAKASAADLGFLYNSYMDDFEFRKPGHPDAIRPGAMAFSSMSPTIVQKNGKTVLIVGSPGSKRIISTVAQVVASWIHKNDIEEAVNKKRFHISGKNFYVEDLSLAEKLLPSGLADLKILKAGNDLFHNGFNAYYGGVHAIGWQNGKWIGTADPRRDGTVGYTK